MDPKKCKSVSPKGVKAFKLTQGAGRENITVLGVANAAGRVLDPLIVNQGQNFQISWRGDRALPNTFYGVSSKGWMTSDVMLGWFDNFIAQEPKRPLLLIFDGHLTHFSVNVIRKAIDNDIILMKLPPHVTDIMQPLDVGMFGPLKRKWEKVLNEHMGLSGPKTNIRPSDFVNMLSDMWHGAMTSSNAIAGFRTTGIYPIDATKYPTDRLDIRIKKTYDDWIMAGRPELSIDEEIVAAPAMEVPTTTIPSTTTPTSTIHFDIGTPSQPGCSKDLAKSTPVIPDMPSTPEPPLSPEVPNVEVVPSFEEVPEIPSIPHPPPPGYRWKYYLFLERVEHCEEQPASKSFEECVLNIMKPVEKRSKPSRRKLNIGKSVVTSKEFVEEIEKDIAEKREKEDEKMRRKTEREQKKAEKEAEKEAKLTSRKQKGKGKAFRNKVIEMGNEELSDDEMEPQVTHIDENDEENQKSDTSEDSNYATDDELILTDSNQKDYLKNVWDCYNPPVIEEDILLKYVGVIFKDKKSQEHLFVGKILKRFLLDKGVAAAALEVECLKKKHGLSNNIFEPVPSHLDRDIGIFPLHDVISKPLKVIPKIGGKLEIPSYIDLAASFRGLKNIKREPLYNNYLCGKLQS